MPWTIPDHGEPDNNLQSILFQEYLDVLVDGINGNNFVVFGCAVTGGADMTPAVAKGGVLSNGVLFAVAAADVTITTAHATLPRLDLIVVTSAGALAVRAGTAAAAPKPPVRTTNDVVLAVVYVPAADTAIATTQITDLRVIRDRDIALKRTTTAVTSTPGTGAQTFATVTLPSGLLLAGRQVRIRAGGNYLGNSGTATWTLTVAYGGTTLFGDATVATTNDADRGSWDLDLLLNASANAAQQLNGIVVFQTPGAKAATSSTFGIGDLALATDVSSSIRGTATVDSDAANRDLIVQWTMSVNNAAVETVCDFSTFELV